VAGRPGRGQRTNHEHSRARERRNVLPGQVSEASLHAIADGCVAHGLAHHEPHPRRFVTGTPGSRGDEVHDQGARPRSAASANRGAKGVGVPQPVGRRQHAAGLRSGLRRPGSCDPCGGARPGCCDPRGCASGDGSRAPCGGDGCSAGTYACSRVSLHGGSGVATPADRQRQFGWHRPPTDTCSPVDMRHRSTPSDRPTVRAGSPQGQTSEQHPSQGAHGACG
jgi:hypothetical protein